MRKKISLSTTVTLLLLTAALTISITMLLAMRYFNNQVQSVSQRQAMYTHINTVDKTVRDYYAELNEEQLRQGITLQAFAQRDPVVEYRYAGIDMFDEMTASIAHDIVTIMLHIRKRPEAERQQVAKVTGTNKDDTLVKKPVRRAGKKIGPNDPCPCGKCYPDGRPIKYKNCCGRNKRK